MQVAFTVLLVGVLVGAVISFVVMGMMQLRRTNSLATRAHAMNMHFSPVDPFNVPRRYGAFALIRGGHGQRAHNVTHGHLAGWPVRAFDFHYEVAHATRRAARHYGVVVVETDMDLPDVLMWHEDDADGPPLAARAALVRAGAWSCTGDVAFARRLMRVCEPLADDPVSIETRRAAIMFCSPVRKSRSDYDQPLERIGQALVELKNFSE